jgi:membrane associated rhomboid family serine protease
MRVLVPLLLLINVGVYLLWYTGYYGDAFMADNFLVSWNSVQEGRWWTLLTTVFSHNMFWHLLINMFVLRSFGTLVESMLGPLRFVIFYLGAGLFGSVCHIVVSKFVLYDPTIAALGASGAVAGLIWLFALIFPREKLLLFAIIPMPAIVGALAFVGLDIWGLYAQAKGGGLPIGHGAHLGGALFGVVFYFFYLRKRIRRMGGYSL